MLLHGSDSDLNSLYHSGLLSVCAFANGCRTRSGNSSEEMSKTDLTQVTEKKTFNIITTIHYCNKSSC